MSTVTVQLLPDDDARCQIVDDDERCERYSFGAKLTGATQTGTVVTIKLCNDHAAMMATMVSGERIIGDTESSS